MEDKPAVSVVLPTFNRSHLIGNAIKSILDQTYQDFEIIIVDDASTDNTKDVVLSFSDERIRYMRLNTNMGVSAAINKGINSAKGTFIGLIADDDTWTSSKLERQVSTFNKGNPKLGLVYCGAIKRDSSGNIYKIHPIARGDIYNRLLKRDYTCGSGTWLVRRACFFDERVGLFDESLHAREDYEMAVRISKYYHVDFVPEGLVSVYTGSNERLSDNCKKVVDGDIQVFNKIVRNIEPHKTFKKRMIVSYHYYYIALHLLLASKTKVGRDYLLKSLYAWPFNLRTITMLFFILFKDKELAHFKKCQRIFRNLEATFRMALSAIKTYMIRKDIDNAI